MIFTQLLDQESGTRSFLLGPRSGGEALFIAVPANLACGR